MQNRREFLLTAAMAASARGATETPHFAISANMWPKNIEEGIKTAARFHFAGIEPFRMNLVKYLDKPQAFKEQLDAAGIKMVTCSNGSIAGMLVDFVDPAKIQQSIHDHVTMARDFLTVFGCRHFKINMGRRPDGGSTDEHLKTVARTLTELGKRTADLGIKLAFHPHIWSPVEREPELRRVLELTDPKFVYIVPDTCHLALGGMNVVKIFSDFYPRIAAVHFKDAEPRFRDYRGPTPTQEEHARVNLYRKLGEGGVDIPGAYAVLRKNNYQGWITLDFDEPRPGEGTVEENLAGYKKYLREKLKVNF